MFLFDVLVFILVLGLLIFFHELGHFVAAKACNIYCDRFSLGMPPRIFGIKVGETDYCVGALPIGGYIKMAGQEDAPASDEEREKDYGHVPPERWFNNRPLWQRFIVILAGPCMNFALAVVLYGIVAAMGGNVPESEMDNRIGQIRADSPASMAQLFEVEDWEADVDFSGQPDATGLMTGDRIVQINGVDVEGFMDIAISSVLGNESKLDVFVERIMQDDSVARFKTQIEPQILDEDSEMAMIGVGPYDSALVAYPEPGTPAHEEGIKAGDLIVRANGEIVDKGTFGMLVAALTENESINVEVERDGERLEIDLRPRVNGRFKGVSFDSSSVALASLKEDGPLEIVYKSKAFAKETGLSLGGIITRIDGKEATVDLMRRLERTMPGSDTVTIELVEGVEPIETSVKNVVQALTSFDDFALPEVLLVGAAYKDEFGLMRRDIVLEIDGVDATGQLLRETRRNRIGETVKFKVKRPAIMWGLLRKEEILDAEVAVSPVGQVGVVWDVKTAFYKCPASQIVPEAFRQSFKTLGLTVTTLKLLLTGRLSAKNLGGPVMIAQVVTSAAHVGLAWLLKMTAFISINLFFFNLLPLPVLDGGLIFFMGIEAVRRKPMPPEVFARIQQVGLVLILGLVLFVTYNDIERIWRNFMP